MRHLHARPLLRKGLLAKTDSLDAQILTDYGSQFQPRITDSIDPVLDEIQCLTKYRRQLIDELHRARMQREHKLPKSVETMLKARIKYLENHIQKTTQKVISIKDKSPSLHQAVKLLTATKGVGDNSALSLIVAMPELGTLSSKQAASLAGLAPFNRDSGSMRGTRKIYGGRKDARQAIYMAALTATRYNDILKAFYQGLLSRGKSKKLALTAVMRKLLCYLNSLMRKHLEQIQTS